MSDPRVMIVIGDVWHEPWRSISLEGQIPTWLATAERPGVVVRHSHGKKLSCVGRFADRWHERLRWSTHGRPRVPAMDAFFGRPFLNVVPKVTVTTWAETGQVAWAQDLPDMYVAQRWKVLGSLTQALTEEWDFIYFTTASSYVNVDRLQQTVRELPRQGLYAGTIHQDWPSGYMFASGANRILSRDVAQRIVKDKRLYLNDIMEDAGMGRVLAAAGIEAVPMPSINIESEEAFANLSESEIREVFHIRIKTTDPSRRQDIELMHRVHDRITNRASA